jgi:hypothetical protein
MTSGSLGDFAESSDGLEPSTPSLTINPLIVIARTAPMGRL